MALRSSGARRAEKPGITLYRCSNRLRLFRSEMRLIAEATPCEPTASLNTTMYWPSILRAASTVIRGAAVVPTVGSSPPLTQLAMSEPDSAPAAASQIRFFVFILVILSR